MKSHWIVICLMLHVSCFKLRASCFSADVVDNRIGTGRSHGSCILGPSVPYGSAHPSPDSAWPVKHVRPKGARHGFGPPTSGWWPGDKVIGFSQLHAQGTGGTPSYGIFRYLCKPSEMIIKEAHPYRLRVRLTEADLEVCVSATAHGAVYQIRDSKGNPRTLPLDCQCKLGGVANCLNGKGEFTGNWNPAPYRCYEWSECDEVTGTLRIAVSFKSSEQAKKYFDEELRGKNVEQVAAAARAQWNEALSRIRVEGVDEAERRRFYSHLAQCFVEPRDRRSDGIGWDDHYTIWDTWKTRFPLMALIDQETFADNVNFFAERFRRSGECTSCYSQGKEFKIGSGGDECDCVIADAFAKKIPGVKWEELRPLLAARWHKRTKGYREKGYTPTREREDYCWRMKSASATMNFAYEDWCCAQVLGDKRFLARSGNWTNVWDATALDVPSGIRGFVRARNADGTFSRTPPRNGFNTDFYEANCWEYSFFVPHDMPELIAKCGGAAAFTKRLEYALENGIVSFDNEPSFQTPWLFSFAGRADLTVRWARKVESLFAGEGYPGDCDAGAMSSYYIFIKLGFYPIAGQDIYVLHGSTYPKITVRVGSGKTLTIRAENYAPGRELAEVKWNGENHDRCFIRHAELAQGGELTFVYR